jgi:Xaa-Pro aminopeptidase
MRQSIVDKQRAAARAHNLDALVAAAPDNVTYSLGFGIPSQGLDVRNRLFLVVVGARGLTKMVAASPEVTLIRGEPDAPEVVSYDEFTDDPMEALAAVVKEAGLAAGRVGIEMDFLPAAYYLRLAEILPGVTFVPAGPIFDELRMVKTPDEIETLRRANRAARFAWIGACRQAKVGMTEREFARLMIDALYAQGMDEVRLVQVGSGRRSSFANPTPTDKPITRGELVKVDILARVGGYYSDTGGAAAAGVASAEHRKTWAGMVRTQRALLSEIRDGTRTRRLWEVFEQGFAAAGLVPVNRFIGHGLGLSLHEAPFIGKERDAVLRQGMVMAVEPVFKVPGDLGFHLEDVVAVTAGGVDPLTDPHDYDELRILG